MTIEEMKRRKAELGYTNERIAQLSGVPLSTVQKVFAGVTQQPRYDTLMALERVLGQGTDRLCESQFEYKAGSGTGGEKKQGEYSVEDFYELTDGRNAELIDGTIIFMEAPSIIHQMLAAAIWRALDTHIRKNKGSCVTFIAPHDVQLGADRKDIFEPDVSVVCDRSKVHRKRIIGAPDLIVEVLSPGTKRKDMLTKLVKYADGGVKEYWLVDPDNKTIIVYPPGEDFEVKIYGFCDKVPVGVFDNKCEIDFTEIYEEIKFLYPSET